jgi:hypothetical protein
MKFGTITLSLIALNVIGFSQELEFKTTANMRAGAIQIKNNVGEKSTTVALGGSLGAETKAINGVSVGTTFYTTNALFGKNDEAMFLSSTNRGYSIVGEAFLKAKLGKTTLKAGRQIVDTPYADSDDVGMVPNTFEGYTLVNQDIADTTIILASLDKWSGVDTDQAEKFNEMQDSGDAVLAGGVIYEGLENTTLQAWHYKLDNANFTYLEAGYETDDFSVAGQYTDQDNSNRAFGVMGAVNMGDFTFTTAYNKVNGTVVNGFGGGPFFTSGEDHTIEIDEIDQEGVLGSIEYSKDAWSLALTHAHFKVGEDDTDYAVSYAMNDNFALDVIYSDMYDDGKMTRVFANYNF